SESKRRRTIFLHARQYRRALPQQVLPPPKTVPRDTTPPPACPSPRPPGIEGLGGLHATLVHVAAGYLERVSHRSACVIVLATCKGKAYEYCSGLWNIRY